MLNHKAKYRREHALTEHQTLKTVEKALNVSVLHIARILTKPFTASNLRILSKRTGRFLHFNILRLEQV